MFPAEIVTLAETLIAECRQRGLTVATVESCTGGLVAGAITAISGSSAVLERGFVTYSNDAKIELVGVPAGYFVPDNVGAVSAECAREMAEGALAHSNVDIAVSITGIAGPDGGTPKKPVGTVHFAAARRGHSSQSFHAKFNGDRAEVRRQSVEKALGMLIEMARR